LLMQNTCYLDILDIDIQCTKTQRIDKAAAAKHSSHSGNWELRTPTEGGVSGTMRDPLSPCLLLDQWLLFFLFVGYL